MGELARSWEREKPPFSRTWSGLRRQRLSMSSRGSSGAELSNEKRVFAPH